ncbi:MAG: 50S ribosomal protein L18 [Nitrospirae bacterium GWC2_56_14]|nr:MAG: 50S ribosomal protein L18 [Nitrospirae bacterium GWC2_56_14]
MNVAKSKLKARQRRHERVRKRVNGTTARPRLSVYKSLSHIYVQLIDDTDGKTVAAASSNEKDIQTGLKHCGNIAAAKKVGANIAQRALSKNIKDVVFDRGGYQYHGCIKALADAAREQGLNF